MLAGMGLLLDSFWRALAYCLQPRIILLSLLPLVLVVAVTAGMFWLFWDDALVGLLLNALNLFVSLLLNVGKLLLFGFLVVARARQNQDAEQSEPT